MRLRAWPILRNIGLCLALFCVAACKPDGSSQVKTPYDQYEAQVIAADGLIVRESELEGLWRLPEFDAFASRAQQHIDDCIKFITDPKHKHSAKYLAIRAMYKLPLPDYLALVRKLLALYDRDHDVGDMLIEALLPHPSLVPQNPIFVNRNQPEVLSLLKEIAARPGWDGWRKDQLDWIMTYDETAGFVVHAIAVSKRLSRFVTYKDVWRDADFDLLANEARSHVDDCIAFLADPSHSDSQKGTAVLAMYKLRLRDYIAVVRKLIDLHERGLVSKETLLGSVVASPDTVPRNVLLENIDDQAVQALLNDVWARPEWNANEREFQTGIKKYVIPIYKVDATLRYLRLEDSLGYLTWPWGTRIVHVRPW